MKYLIYILMDPFYYEVRYVGLSTRGIRRAKDHFCPCNLKVNTHKTNWIKSVIRQGSMPIIRVVQQWRSMGYKELCAAEVYWISYFKGVGCPLTNATDGGGGMIGYIHSKETREKLSVANKGFKHTPEAVDKIRRASTGRKYPNRKKPIYTDSEYLDKLSDKMFGNKYGLGTKHTEEWKQDNAKRMAGNKNALGSTHTEEWKKEASERLKGNKYRLGKVPYNKGVYQTHCKHGHLMDEENTYLYKNGRRKCRACAREQMRKKRAKMALGNSVCS